MNQSETVDWNDLKGRLVDSLDHDVSQEELERLFAERAESLARRSGDTSHVEGSPMFRFSLGAAQFAVELSYVRTIVTPRWVTRIPGAPNHLTSVTHMGGRIVSLLRLDRLLDVSEVTATPKRYLLLEHQGLRLGVAANELLGIDTIDLNDLNAAGQKAGGELLRGVSNDMTLVLDGARTILDLRIEVGRTDQG